MPTTNQNLHEFGATYSLDVYECFPGHGRKVGHWFASVAIAGALTVGERFPTREAAESWGRATLAARLAMSAADVIVERAAWVASHQTKAVA